MRAWIARGLLLFNLPVWLGQVWPEGAPPFARAVNVAFLSATLVVFALEGFRRQSSPRA